MDGEGRLAAPAVVDPDAEGAQRPEQARVGAVSQPRVAVHPDGAGGERRDRGQEAQDGAGETGVDVGRSPQRSRA